jgi:hypothetical protein
MRLEAMEAMEGKKEGRGPTKTAVPQATDNFLIGQQEQPIEFAASC